MQAVPIGGIHTRTRRPSPLYQSLSPAPETKWGGGWPRLSAYHLLLRVHTNDCACVLGSDCHRSCSGRSQSSQFGGASLVSLPPSFSLAHACHNDKEAHQPVLCVMHHTPLALPPPWYSLLSIYSSVVRNDKQRRWEERGKWGNGGNEKMLLGKVVLGGKHHQGSAWVAAQ